MNERVRKCVCVFSASVCVGVLMRFSKSVYKYVYIVKNVL